MGLKRAENQVKILLQETIIALCRNTLNSYGEVSVEGLLGVTLDNEEIFLVSINEMFNNPGVAKKAKKNLKRSKEANDGSESESEHSDGEDHGDAPKKRKKKRARKKKKKTDQGSGGSGEDSDSSSNQDNQDDDIDGTETEANTTQEDNNHTEQTAHEIRPEAPSSRNTIPDDQLQKKSEMDDNGPQDDEESNDLQKIKIKEECEEDDDEDLVFVKEEIGDGSYNQNQYSNYSSDGQMFMPQGGMHGGQSGLMQMPGPAGVSNQYSQQDFMGDISNMSQGSDSQQQMMGFSPGQQNLSFTGASPVAGPSSASGRFQFHITFLLHTPCLVLQSSL